MSHHHAIAAALVLAIAASPIAATGSAAQNGQGFGTEEDIAYARDLWDYMADRRLVGEDAIRSHPYPGTEPHGIVLEQLETTARIGDHEGVLIVKSNFLDGEPTIDDVLAAERKQHLESTTIMFRREQGYAPDAADWFWAKYAPGGDLDETPDGVPMAGRVAGCITCHTDAPGLDFVFTHDRY